MSSYLDDERKEQQRRSGTGPTNVCGDVAVMVAGIGKAAKKSGISAQGKGGGGGKAESRKPGKKSRKPKAESGRRKAES
jgi:hypothetical protein